MEKENWLKVGRGALIAASGAAAIAGLQFIAGSDLSSLCNENSQWMCNQFLLPLVAWVVPVAVNAVREWMKEGAEKPMTEK